MTSDPALAKHSFLFLHFSLRTWPVLHRNGQFDTEPALPRDGDGPAWTLARRSLPDLQATVRPEDGLADCVTDDSPN